MIVNFEDITEDLSEEEMNFKDDVKDFLLKVLSNTPSHQIKQSDLIQMINTYFAINRGPESIKLSTVRLRKYFNYFRTNGILPLIATSKGCYISKSKEEIENQILSLEQRAKQILKAAEGMKKLLS